MLHALLLSTILVPASGPAHSLVGAPQFAPVKVWLSERDGVTRGDKIRVYVRTEVDGFLTVLHVEPDGRVRVLFPLDPGDDNFVRGQKDYEIRGRGDRHAFTVFESNGLGTVYAAFSRDPFQYNFEGLVRGTHWDYAQDDVWRVVDDPEAELTNLVSQLTGEGGFDYDLVHYDIYDVVAYQRQGYGGVRSAYYYDPFYCDPFYCNPFYYGGYGPGLHISVGFGFGFHRHRHFRRHGFFFYDPFFYDPFFFGPFGFHRPRFIGFVGHSPGVIFVGRPGGYTFKSFDRSVSDPVQPRSRSWAGDGRRIGTPTSAAGDVGAGGVGDDGTSWRRRATTVTPRTPETPATTGTGRSTTTTRRPAPTESGGGEIAPPNVTPRAPVGGETGGRRRISVTPRDGGGNDAEAEGGRRAIEPTSATPDDQEVRHYTIRIRGGQPTPATTTGDATGRRLSPTTFSDRDDDEDEDEARRSATPIDNRSIGIGRIRTVSPRGGSTVSSGGTVRTPSSRSITPGSYGRISPSNSAGTRSTSRYSAPRTTTTRSYTTPRRTTTPSYSAPRTTTRSSGSTATSSRRPTTTRSQPQRRKD
jgi:hypothetical protein